MILEGELTDLRKRLDAYFGSQSESMLGFESGGTLEKPDVVEKPEMLRSLEQAESLGALPYSGGIEDQPHVWIQAIAVCRNARNIFFMSKKMSDDLA